MVYTVNLLDWRALRRRRCARFWLLLLIGLWLITLMAVVSERCAERQAQAAQLTHREGLRDLLHKLAQRDKQLNAEHQQQQAWRLRQQLSEQTRRWQPLLESLSNQMPEQAWLTALQWQSGVLSLSGLALGFSAVSAVDSSLKEMPGFGAVTAGATRKDDQGRWQFSYQLAVGGANENID